MRCLAAFLVFVLIGVVTTITYSPARVWTGALWLRVLVLLGLKPKDLL